MESEKINDEKGRKENKYSVESWRLLKMSENNSKVKFEEYLLRQNNNKLKDMTRKLLKERK
jgi:hypothetical protein